MISAVSVVFSLICRILINCSMFFDYQSALDYSFDHDTWLLYALFPFNTNSPIHQFIIITFGFLVPIGSITYSLMYGLSHRRRMQQRQ